MTPAAPPPPRVLFLGSLYAGHRTRFLNLRANTAGDERIRAEYLTVSGWKSNGWIERLPVGSPGLRGRARALLQSGQIARVPRPDVIWTSVGDETLAPYAWALRGPFDRPLVMDADATPALLEEHAEVYYRRPPKTGLSRAWLDLRRRLVFSKVTLFTAWSRWAADALEREGIPRRRIRLLPPGVDLGQWRYTARWPTGPLRALFVGADFERKGGAMLVDVIRERFRGRIELDIVTRADVPSGPGIRVHRAEPNSPLLRRLFAEAHLFVMPSRAECFGIAAIEAMASGLPVLMGDAGAAREIVDEGETGWVVKAAHREIAAALEAATRWPERLAAMGKRARAVAERRYDGRRNDRDLVRLILELHARSSHRPVERCLPSACQPAQSSSTAS